jgi:hypothetical protein
MGERVISGLVFGHNFTCVGLKKSKSQHLLLFKGPKNGFIFMCDTHSISMHAELGECLHVAAISK